MEASVKEGKILINTMNWQFRPGKTTSVTLYVIDAVKVYSLF